MRTRNFLLAAIVAIFFLVGSAFGQSGEKYIQQMQADNNPPCVIDLDPVRSPFTVRDIAEKRHVSYSEAARINVDQQCKELHAAIALRNMQEARSPEMKRRFATLFIANAVTANQTPSYFGITTDEVQFAQAAYASYREKATNAERLASNNTPHP